VYPLINTKSLISANFIRGVNLVHLSNKSQKIKSHKSFNLVRCSFWTVLPPSLSSFRTDASASQWTKPPKKQSEGVRFC